MQTGKILVIDDDDKSREFLNAFLNYKGYQVVHSGDVSEALRLIDEKEFDLVITDLMMPKMNGLELVKRIKSSHPAIVTIVYSGYCSNEMMANLLKAGAFFCLDKPFNLSEMETHVKRGLEHHSIQSRTFKGKPTVKNRSLMSNIVGDSNKILSLLEMVEKVAESDSTVLIQGESGTGKELFARAIHDLSNRKNRNFVPVNSAAIPEELLESELFGHVKGAFTGAIANRIGRFEMADKGSIFLDEIGDMKPSLQVKILRALQGKEFEPVGSSKPQKVDVRIIAATNKDLEQLVANRDFREDLYYRLSVIPITIPPLRERREDIPLLIHSFLTRFNSDRKHAVKGFSREALDILCNYSWPGNVRELENLVERMVILKDSGFITPDDLPEKYLSGQTLVPAPPLRASEGLPAEGICLNSAVEAFENNLIQQALARTKGNKKEAASLLNLKRTTLIEKLKKKNLVYNEE